MPTPGKKTRPKEAKSSFSDPASYKTEEDINEQLRVAAEKINKKEKKEVNPFYIRVSNRFRFAKYAVVFVLISFVLVMFTFFRSSITLDNFRYFFRYIDTRSAVESNNTIKYDSSSVSDAAIYKGSVAIVDDDSLQIYDLGGDNVLSATLHYANPNLICSNQFILVYNIGGTSYSIYNSLSRIHEQTLGNEISSASMNAGGMYIIVSKTLEYRSVVTLYDSDFTELYVWYTPDKLVMDTAISDNGRDFVITALGTREDGSCYTEILVCKVGSEEKTAQFSLDNVVVLKAACFDNGSFVLLCSDGVYFYDRNGTELKRVSYDGYIPVKAEINGDYIYFALNKNVVGSEHSVTILNQSGETVFNGVVNGEITDAASSKDAMYFLLERQLVRVPFSGGEVLYRDVTANGTGVMCVDTERVLICFPEKTEVVSVNELFFESRTIRK